MQYHGASYSEDVWDIFWYEKNLQGDIVAVYDQAGTMLIYYCYDAWGIASLYFYNGATADSIAAKNPFRYRGYYYDTDLALYYCGTRYYDANTGRWINADGYVSTGTGLLGYNMYAYCNNNPVMFVDHNGENPVFLLCVSAIVFVWSCFALTVLDGFTKEDSDIVQFEKEREGISDQHIYFTQTEFNDIEIFGDEVATSGEFRTGVYKEIGKSGNHSLETEVLSFGQYISLIGFGTEFNLFKMSYIEEYEISDNQKIAMSVGFSIGVGIKASLLSKTGLGLALIPGVEIMIDWDA